MKNNTIRRLLFTAISCVTLQQVQAQNAILQKSVAPSGAITFIELSTTGSERKESSQAAIVLQELLKLQPQDELRAVRAHRDDLGFTHTQYAQYYEGVPVEYGTYATHARNGIIETLNGEVVQLHNLKVVPAITEKEALKRALTSVGASKYQWQMESKDGLSEQGRNELKSKLFPKGELLISRDLDVSTGGRLAYKFAIYAQQPASQQYVYVDAHSGVVFRKDPVSQHTNAPATAATSYSGTRSITTDQFAVGQFRLRETGRGSSATCGSGSAGIETYNSNGSDFTNTSTNWGGDAALDAHWAAEQTYDYFRNTFCRNSYDGTGGTLKIYAHAGSVDNAYWDTNGKFAVFGDGAGRFASLTSLDIVAHELAHGFTQNMINPDPSQREPASMNEGISDIWAACVERSVDPNKQTYLMGEDAIRSGFRCLRNLQDVNNGVDPSFCANTSTNEVGYPDVYGGPRYDTRSNFDPHINSTIISHAFYLLAEGGYATNTVGTTYGVSGIGITKAAQILFRVEEAHYLSSYSGFNDARNAMISVAQAMFGNCSAEVLAVRNAWYAVGVGSAGTPGGPISITGSYYCPRCNNTATSTLQDYNSVAPGTYYITLGPGDATFQPWSFGDSGAQGAYNTNGNHTGVVTLQPYGGVSITVSATSPCGATTTRSFRISARGSALVASPNPASSELVITPTETRELPLTQEGQPLVNREKVENTPYEAELYDNFGKLVKSMHSEGGRLQMDVNSIPDGLYNLRTTQGKQVKVDHIQIKH